MTRLFLDSQNLGSVWDLFSTLDNRQTLTCSLELISSFRNGNINPEGFNLAAYDQKAQRTSPHKGDVKKDRGNNELYLSTEYEEEGERSKGVVPEAVLGAIDQEIENVVDRVASGESRAWITTLGKALLDYNISLPEYLESASRLTKRQPILGLAQEIMESETLRMKNLTALQSYMLDSGTGIDSIHQDIDEYLYKDFIPEVLVQGYLVKGIGVVSGRKIFDTTQLAIPGSIWFYYQYGDGDFDYIRPVDMLGSGYLPLYDLEEDPNDSLEELNGIPLVEDPSDEEVKEFHRAAVSIDAGDLFKTPEGIMELDSVGKLRKVVTLAPLGGAVAKTGELPGANIPVRSLGSESRSELEDGSDFAGGTELTG